jgi:hypothetical protein
MFDVKISVIAAGIAFIVSFLLGLLNGASLPFLIIRPLIFGVLFFVIAAIVYFLVSHFLPELLDGELPESIEAGNALSPGSRINITEEEPAGMPFYTTHAAPAAQADNSENGLGDISNLLKTGRAAGPAETGYPGLDQSDEDGYTKSEAVHAGVQNNGGFTGSGSAAPKTVTVTVTVPDSEESMDMLPDLDTMARAFLPDSGEDKADTTEYSTSDDPLKRPAAGSRGRKMEGDFNPQDLAAGIRTILKKEG